MIRLLASTALLAFACSTTHLDASDPGSPEESPDAGATLAAPDAGPPPAPPDAGPPPAPPDAGPSGPWTRDWIADPPIVTAAAPGLLYGLSDVHGGYDRAVALLGNAGLAAVDASANATWSGGNAVLVVTGDCIDKGDQSVEVLDLFRELEADAPRTGGRVIVTLGNHEAEFLHDPGNTKADALRAELGALGVTAGEFAAPTSRWGVFLHRRPLAALVSGWFFSHAGSTGGRTVDQLATAFRAAVAADDYGASVLIGATSTLEDRDWWTSAVLTRNLAALPAKHVVMGHDPNAFSEQGLIGAHFGGRLVHIDTGMSPAVDNSQGRLLQIVGAGTAAETAYSISHSGRRDVVSLTAP
jgi:hypothetical protein